MIRTAISLAVCLALSANASAVTLSLQLEAGVLEGKNPIDDQYVLYHGAELSHGVQMTSPVVGIAPRLDIGPVAFTVGYRDMGHQYIDSDIIADNDYFKCRYKTTCPKPIELWHTRMSLDEAYASVGYKLRAGPVALVPTVGMALERLPTTVEVTRPYAWHHGEVTWYTGDGRQAQPFLGVDVEGSQFGAGIYYLSTCKLPTAMGDPGLGSHALYARLTYRFVSPLAL